MSYKVKLITYLFSCVLISFSKSFKIFLNLAEFCNIEKLRFNLALAKLSKEGIFQITLGSKANFLLIGISLIKVFKADVRTRPNTS